MGNHDESNVINVFLYLMMVSLVVLYSRQRTRLGSYRLKKTIFFTSKRMRSLYEIQEEARIHFRNTSHRLLLSLERCLYFLQIYALPLSLMSRISEIDLMVWLSYEQIPDSVWIIDLLRASHGKVWLYCSRNSNMQITIFLPIPLQSMEDDSCSNSFAICIQIFPSRCVYFTWKLLCEEELPWDQKQDSERLSSYSRRASGS